MNIDKLFSEAVQNGDLTEEAALSAKHHLLHEEEQETPWYLHALIAVGAWLAAIFFIVFTGALFGSLIFEKTGAALITGLVLLAVTVVVRRSAKGAFVRQLCLALSVTAHGLIFFGLTVVIPRAWNTGLLSLAAGMLAALLYELYSDTLHRFLSCFTALLMATVWIRYEYAPPFLLSLNTAVLMAHLAALGWIFVRPATSTRFRALGFAVTISLLVLVLPHFTKWDLALRSTRAAWPIKIVLTLSSLAFLRWIAGPPSSSPVWLLGASALLLLGIVATPGILVGVLLLGLGFALQERLLTGLGLVFLPAFLALHYYRMDITLLQKSIALAAAGLILLIARAMVQRLPAVPSRLP